MCGSRSGFAKNILMAGIRLITAKSRKGNSPFCSGQFQSGNHINGGSAPPTEQLPNDRFRPAAPVTFRFRAIDFALEPYEQKIPTPSFPLIIIADGNDHDRALPMDYLLILQIR